MTTGDIEGASADYKPRHKRLSGPPRNSLDVADITSGGFHTKRVSDPLNPIHVIHGAVLRLDDSSKPRSLPAAHAGPDPRYNTSDIVGASPGWKSHTIPKEARRTYRETNKLGDIKGATADTYKPYPNTKRQTNPLVPVYINLDGIPIINDFSNTLEPESSSPPPPR
jgi:hypothetical protein